MRSCFISDNDLTRVLCKCSDFQPYYFNESIVPYEAMAIQSKPGQREENSLMPPPPHDLAMGGKGHTGMRLHLFSPPARRGFSLFTFRPPLAMFCSVPRGCPTRARRLESNPQSKYSNLRQLRLF